MEIEHFFQCPFCEQTISMLLDPSVEEQTYIEDCEVCCRPVEIYFRIEDEEVVEFSASSAA
jgi:transcription elongation factor Elf1